MSKLEEGIEVSSSPDLEIMISKGLKISEEDQKLIRDFCSTCYKALELQGKYSCYLSSNRKKSHIVTTAVCAFSEGNIKIYCHERAMADILRSIAHEMFHLRQHELDLVPPRISKKHYLNPIEWHANVASGSMLSYFAQKVGKDRIYR